MKFKVNLIMFVSLLLFPLPAGAREEAAVVKQVIDGETLLLSDGREIRLIGVSLVHTGGSQLERKDYDRVIYLSKRFIQGAVEGRAVILSHDPAYDNIRNHDRNGRELAYVWYSIYYQDTFEEGLGSYGRSTEQRLLNEEVIKRGYAFADRTTNYEQRGVFIQHEKRSQELEKGVWGAEPALYENLLERAKGARSGSVSKFISQGTRRMSMESARTTLTELVELVPTDYRAYYERSWLGADPYQDQVKDENLEDIKKAIELSPNNPKCYAQKQFLLRLLGRHGEAGAAYEEAANLAAKFGMIAAVTYLADQERTEGRLEEIKGEKMEGFSADAFRAGLNEDHFLFFMARYKELGSRKNAAAENIFQRKLGHPVFAAYYRKHKPFIRKATPHEIIYATRWAQEGWDEPEEILKYMERTGEV